MQWIDGKIKVSLISLKIKVLLLMVLRVNVVDIKLSVQAACQKILHRASINYLA